MALERPGPPLIAVSTSEVIELAPTIFTEYGDRYHEALAGKGAAEYILGLAGIELLMRKPQNLRFGAFFDPPLGDESKPPRVVRLAAGNYTEHGEPRRFAVTPVGEVGKGSFDPYKGVPEQLAKAAQWAAAFSRLYGITRQDTGARIDPAYKAPSEPVQDGTVNWGEFFVRVAKSFLRPDQRPVTRPS